ncbi:hypothetical protein BYT27DRAFT_7265734 [Phlegmacium glaucopus]|nr:hypothetical protein BYT27DRAFT_7265734 [Phlegmacium glaucopus]
MRTIRPSIQSATPVVSVVNTTDIERIGEGLPVSAGNARCALMGFPGQGSQYQGMGHYLAQQYSSFNAIMTDAANKVSALTGYLILPFFVDHILYALGWNVLVSMLMPSWATAWEKSLQQVYSLLMLHDFCLYIQSVIARAFSFEVASEEKVAHYISKLDIDSHVAISVYKGPESHIVSGEMKVIEKMISMVEVDGLQATKLVVDQGEFNITFAPNLTFCQASIAPALPALKAWLDEQETSFDALEKPFFKFSTARGKEIAKLKLEY